MSITILTDTPAVARPVTFRFQAEDGTTPVAPYRVDTVTFYFLERSFASGTPRAYTRTVGGTPQTITYTDARPVAVVGVPECPAYDPADPARAFLSPLPTADDGTPAVGLFGYEWDPAGAREGDYFVCWTWTPVVEGEPTSEYVLFSFRGDTAAGTPVPALRTIPDKYRMLIDRYLPSHIKDQVSSRDVTFDVLDRLGAATGDLFEVVEDLANQLLGLTDPNSTPETYLPHLARLFGLPLRTTDPALWRRQIKEAVPTFKAKGTERGLRAALAASGVSLTKLVRYWQVVPSGAYREGFLVAPGEAGTAAVYDLDRLAVLPVQNEDFSVFLRPAGAAEYTQFDPAYVTFFTAAGKTTVTWAGETQTPPVSLAAGDYLLVSYKIGTAADPDVEEYVRGLPLADARDEALVSYPRKNWNVRLIEPDDVMFPLACPVRHPFTDPVVFGRVRTDFPYGEGVYNSEEFNGSTRDSTSPCDTDASFADRCGFCVSSKIGLDVEVEELSDHRLAEVTEIARDNLPFDAVLHSVNVTGAVHDLLVPPVEEVECLMTVEVDDKVVLSNLDFSRDREDLADPAEFRRDALAGVSAVGSGTGSGTNDAVTIWSPGIDFSGIGLSLTSHVLTILSGPDAGSHTLANFRGGAADLGTAVGWPINPAGFPFRLSNQLYSQVNASVFRANRYVFTDVALKVSEHVLVTAAEGAAWRLVVVVGANAGSYPVLKVNPDNSVEIGGWPAAGAVTGLVYELRAANNSLEASGDKGMVVTRPEGRVETDLVRAEYGVRPGDYAEIDGDQYLITEFLDPDGATERFVVKGYQGGDVAGAETVTIFRRLVETAVGHLGLRGMVLAAGPDEAALQIVDGTSPPASPTEPDDWKDSYLILIGTNYYQIDAWSGTTLSLAGPLLPWGVGTPASAPWTLVHFPKTQPVMVANGTVLPWADRRNPDVVVITSETVSMGAGLRAGLLNSPGADMVGSWEDIWVEISED